MGVRKEEKRKKRSRGDERRGGWEDRDEKE